MAEAAALALAAMVNDTLNFNNTGFFSEFPQSTTPNSSSRPNPSPNYSPTAQLIARLRSSRSIGTSTPQLLHLV
jgi:hypothetical protein